MKKIVVIFFLFLININSVNADNKIKVTLNKCVDGDTAYFNLDNEVIKTRFLAIDTPESTNSIEPYGKDASNFTCNKLKNASKIEIEYDKGSDKFDKYNRHLVWVFIDDYLLQDLIIKEGYAEVAYLYGDYKYTDLLKDHEATAKASKLNIWSDNEENNKNDLYLIIGILIIILGCIFNKKYRNKIFNKIKKQIT